MTSMSGDAPGFASGLKKPSGRSGFGQQASSRKATAPNFSLGHSTRESMSKVFISQEHVAVENKCKEGPGPIYEMPGSMDRQASALKESAPHYSFSKSGRMKGQDNWVPGPGSYSKPGALGQQVDSAKQTNPTFRFSNTTRDQQSKRFISSAHVDGIKGTMGAPPGAYQPLDCLGAQPISSRVSSPAFSIPRMDRMRNNYEKLAQSMPSVGSYEAWGCLGKQPLSKNNTVPAFGFGSSSREREGHRFLSAGHMAKTNAGLYSPSHFRNQTEQNTTSLGRQGLSQRCSSPMTKFGTSSRMVYKTNDTPGPGAYD